MHVGQPSLDDVYDLGELMFGGKEKFDTWLNNPSTFLYDEVPLTLLYNAEVVSKVYDALMRMQYESLNNW